MAPPTDPLDPQPTPSKQPGSRQAMLVLVIAFLLVFLGWRTLGRPTDRVAWAQDVQAVMAQAQTQNKPVLMSFTADWCGPCQQLKARAFSRPEVAETISRLVLPLKIDLTTPSAAGAELCQRYQIEGTPTLLLLAPDGSEISRRVGVIDPDELVDWLTQPRG
ncbi:MAG: thioredoxin family protein [Phycisphaeraceae bacterium]|nr:thioredoxin family protein [Phycisphaeraceae bacterium]